MAFARGPPRADRPRCRSRSALPAPRPPRLKLLSQRQQLLASAASNTTVIRFFPCGVWHRRCRNSCGGLSMHKIVKHLLAQLCVATTMTGAAFAADIDKKLTDRIDAATAVIHELAGT